MAWTARKPGVETASRKEQEVREREQRFLDVARAILVEHGFNELNLDRVAEATGWSKGTVHGHFKTKEDLVTALAAQTTEKRLEFFERAARFNGRPRERACAIGLADELFARLHPHYFGTELVIKMASLQERATPERRLALQAPDQRCFQTINTIIVDAVRVGDLILDPPTTTTDITFSCISQAIGAHTAMLNFGPLFSEMGLVNPFASLRESYHRLFDGYNFRPLKREWDYDETTRRIAREIFPDECARVVLS